MELIHLNIAVFYCNSFYEREQACDYFFLSFSFSHFVSSYKLSCDVNLVPPVTIFFMHLIEYSLIYLLNFAFDDPI